MLPGIHCKSSWSAFGVIRVRVVCDFYVFCLISCRYQRAGDLVLQIWAREVYLLRSLEYKEPFVFVLAIFVTREARAPIDVNGRQ
jgi:hypothetical protein